jgi:transcriptional regulator with XRE-family HTH domain
LNLRHGYLANLKWDQNNMKKQTLGSVLKNRREFLRLTQRELAAKLGVKASHVAYLENGRRRPSLSLLHRLSTVMGLESESIFLLAHPEAKDLIAPREGFNAERPENAWRNFLKDRSLIARHQIKPSELRVLKQVNMLGRVSSPRQFLFILNSIRQAVDQD